MRRKMRKFGNGGYSTVDPENPVPSIDDDTRSRAMKYVEGASEESRDIGAPVTRSAAKSTSKVSQTVVPPKADAPYSKPAGDYVNPEKGLVAVHPEDYVTPGGVLKGMFKQVVKSGVKRAETAAANTAAKNVTRKAEEGFNPSESLDALKPTRNISVKGKDIPVRQGKTNLGGSKEGMGVKEVTAKSGKKIPVKRQKEEMVDDGGSGMFKRGGSVSSASRRADGCATKGKTRGKYI
jgi:hypothetical protein